MPRADQRPRSRPHIHTFAESLVFARRLARAVGWPLASVRLHRFPDGESLVRIRLPSGVHAVLVRSLHEPDTKLIQTLLAGDALRRAGARRVTLVAPYLPYMRQDAVFAPGEPISQRVVGRCLRDVFDRVLTIEAHLHRVRSLREAIGRGSRSVSAAPVLAEWVRHAGSDVLVVGPDEESAPWVRAIARAAGTAWIVGKKTRLRDRVVRIRFSQVPPCRRAVIVDDIASTGVTVAVAAEALQRGGVRAVDALVVHAIFAAGAIARIRAAGVHRIVSCDTIPHPTNAIGAAPLLVDALKEDPR